MFVTSSRSNCLNGFEWNMELIYLTLWINIGYFSLYHLHQFSSLSTRVQTAGAANIYNFDARRIEYSLFTRIGILTVVMLKKMFTFPALFFFHNLSVQFFNKMSFVLFLKFTYGPYRDLRLRSSFRVNRSTFIQ